jgi:glyoxylate carboligase
MSRTSVADQFVQVLRQAGVQRIYGVVGDSLNLIVDAIRRTDDIEWVYVRNEEAGAFAAAAEAQLSGRLAVCAGSCGPCRYSHSCRRRHSWSARSGWHRPAPAWSASRPAGSRRSAPSGSPSPAA